MNSYNLNQIEDSVFFTKDTYLDKNFLFLIPEVPFSPELRTLLIKWDFSQLHSAGAISHSQASVLPSDAAAVQQAQPKQQSDSQELLKKVETEYKKYYAFTKQIYANFKANHELPPARLIADRVKELCEFVKEHQQLILRLRILHRLDEENYLVSHSLRSTVFAIIIGLQLKMPSFKLIDLGVSALLHEIGMTYLPEATYLRSGGLTEKERTAVKAHPIISYRILRENSFSLPICIGALDHHERENGSGYPRGLTEEKISLDGKIIAVACAYEASTADRPYKKATDACTGLIELLRNENKVYSEPILKALLYSLSFYPIGSFVHLSNGTIGEVVDINPADPRYPFVQIYQGADKAKVISTSAEGIRIVKPLTITEQENLLNTEQDS